MLIILSCILATMLISCNKEYYAGEDGVTWSKNMIAMYIDCNELDLELEGNRIYATIKGDKISKRFNPVKFDSLANANNDTEYTSTILGSNISINDSIYSVSIKCDKDIDETHLAGDELNDLFTFESSTYFTIIQDHYTRREADVIKMKAKDITQVETKVMESYFYLFLDTPPAQSGTYNFEVSIRLSQKTLKNNIAIEF
jgi:hypothetical protein